MPNNTYTDDLKIKDALKRRDKGQIMKHLHLIPGWVAPEGKVVDERIEQVLLSQNPSAINVISKYLSRWAAPNGRPINTKIEQILISHCTSAIKSISRHLNHWVAPEGRVMDDRIIRILKTRRLSAIKPILRRIPHWVAPEGQVMDERIEQVLKSNNMEIQWKILPQLINWVYQDGVKNESNLRSTLGYLKSDSLTSAFLSSLESKQRDCPLNDGPQEIQAIENQPMRSKENTLIAGNRNIFFNQEQSSPRGLKRNREENDEFQEPAPKKERKILKPLSKIDIDKEMAYYRNLFEFGYESNPLFWESMFQTENEMPRQSLEDMELSGDDYIYDDFYNSNV